MKNFGNGTELSEDKFYYGILSYGIASKNRKLN